MQTRVSNYLSACGVPADDVDDLAAAVVHAICRSIGESDGWEYAVMDLADQVVDVHEDREMPVRSLLGWFAGNCYPREAVIYTAAGWSPQEAITVRQAVLDMALREVPHQKQAQFLLAYDYAVEGDSRFDRACFEWARVGLPAAKCEFYIRSGATPGQARDRVLG